ncbi:DUF3488 domain-containing protein [Anaerococcus provencensis]|uniref:DUF3488 domain-containing protein n=1 Tax=Anaerococcus provencensis TaxID=938293 RepID=UPI0002E51395|nr:DUF3488 domain-containing protein [Anaerococcus provencensis]
MNKRFEKVLSQTISIIILIIFVTTIISMRSPIWLVTYIWAFAFLLAWILMLVFALHILLQKDAFGFSILTAILTALAFGLLSIPAILVLSRFVPQIPATISFANQLLNKNSQMILYTSLIVLYVFHLINSLKLKRAMTNSQDLSEESLAYDHEDTSDNNLFDDNLKDENEEITKENNNISSEDLKIGEKIVFESNNDEKIEYNTEKVIFVEDLTDEDLINEEGEGNNG